MARPRTLFDKIWDSHLVHQQDDGTCLIYIDRHLVHEVTSAQAFEGLRLAGRGVRRPEATLAVADHNVPTTDRSNGIEDPESKLQVDTLQENCEEFGIEFYGMDDIRQGIVHIIGPEQGMTQPGITLVCGDSHTSTHGAFGALAFGIGTSEVEHVLATQTLIQNPLKNMRISVDGDLPNGVTAKDLILAIIGTIGTAGGTGHVIEYDGKAVRDLTMEGRMTVCNMSIEAGARAGLIAPDQTTFDYLMGRPMAPKGAAWEDAVSHWKTLPSDPGASYDKEVSLAAADIIPQVTWGTSPQDVVPIDGRIPDPADVDDSGRKEAIWGRSLKYMGLEPGTAVTDIKRSTTSSSAPAPMAASRICAASSKLSRAARSRTSVQALVVPGSGLIKEQAEQEGIDKVLIEAGFEWREPGCSMCLAMNADKVGAGERCASTSNRNFEGRQGRGARTHLVSPAMAAAAAVKGHLADVRDFA